MAQKIAYDQKVLNKIKHEAAEIVRSWAEQNRIQVDATDEFIYLIWAGKTPEGYRCMVTFKNLSKLYFEISKNLKTGETIMSCLECYEYVVKPSESEPIQFISQKKPDLY
jgi:hypothetical protein